MLLNLLQRIVLSFLSFQECVINRSVGKLQKTALQKLDHEQGM